MKKLKGDLTKINRVWSNKEKLRPSNIIASNYDSYSDGMSQSLLGMWQHCKRSLVLRVCGFEGVRKASNTNFGSITHDVNDQAYTVGKLPSAKKLNEYIDDSCQAQLGKGMLISQQQLEYDAALVEAIMTEYFKYYKKDFTDKNFYDVECTFQNRYQGFHLNGKIDGKYRTRVKKKKMLMEHKTKGQISENNILLMLPLDFQNLFYIFNDWLETNELASGVLYNVIRRPQNKPHKNEAILPFKKRILGLIQDNPSYYFHRWEQCYSEQKVKTFSEELSFMLDEIQNNIYYRVYPSTKNCLSPFPCQYLQACSNDCLDCLVKDVPLNREITEDTNANKLKGVKNASKKIKTTLKKALPARKKPVPKRRVRSSN